MPIAASPVVKITLVCLFVLLAAQALIGVLSFSSLEDLVRDTRADQMEVVAHRMKNGIETGLHLGKPLTQFFGLTTLLAEGRQRSGELAGVAVVLPDGAEVVSLNGLPRPDVLHKLLSAFGEGRGRGAAGGDEIRLRPSGVALTVTQGRLLLALPLQDVAGHIAGFLILEGEESRALHALVEQNLRVLFLITCFAALLFSAAFRFGGATSSRARFLVPLVTLVLAQGGYALYTISTFRATWLEVVHKNVDILAADLGKDLNRVLAYGFRLEELRDVEAPLSRLVRDFPILEAIDLIDAEGRLLTRADANGKLAAAANQHLRPDFSSELALGMEEGAAQAQGRLVFHLNEQTIAREVRNRVLDVLTVAIVALVTAIEMLLISTFLVNRGQDDVAAVPGRLARPIVFGFLFVWALPLGFLPLYARQLATTSLLPQNLLLSLPVVLEMGASLLAALFAGRLTDRKGWRVPVLSGLVTFPLAMLACAFADNLYSLMLARTAIGVTYGLAWMGMYGFIVLHSPVAQLGRNITELAAGIYAGHLSGVAIGAMLMDRLGFRWVFLIGAALMILPLGGACVLSRVRLNAPVSANIAPATRSGKLLSLFRDKGFALLLLGSIIPTALIQTGLISFALPLYLVSFDVLTADIGRILMLYGLCLTYAGPVLGRMSDRLAVSGTVSRKSWVSWGSLLVGGGLFLLLAVPGMVGAAFAMLLIAVAACLLHASQSSYMLAQPAVQRYGAASAVSIMRTADKFGQMLGPMLMGILFSVMSMNASFALLALCCMGTALLFLWFAPREGGTDLERAKPSL
ncbi:MFS transporter [Betaproteobacteria bacterium]|nr:MFS transporter [Betaproteobacteria bacterium]GHU09617.1 MFS transporter [Betaproteobacteria bacterium]GHU27970.1 MFS transporter [Betaproteobacteria bacterium]